MKQVLLKMINTKNDVSLFILRVVLGVVIFPHGAQKMFGWFGGNGWAMTIDLWNQWWGFPSIVTILVILAESIGMICLILGFFGRFMAGSIFAVMIGAIYMVHGQWGFFMNWYSEADQGEGFQFHLLVLAIAIAIAIKGSGRLSIDRLIVKKSP